MTTYVAFLRAVNVGKRRVAMAQLRDEVTALDLDDVVTYVNSGNVAFTTSAKRTTAGVKRAAEAMTNDTDHLIAEGRELHWLIRGSFMDSTLKAKDWRTLGDEPTTNRNTTMLAKLVDRLV